MITHRIYEIHGVKVGCTSTTLEKRQAWYPEGTVLTLIEELHDATDQEAGDREWWWADKKGYKHYQHYENTIKSLQAPNTFVTLSLEKRIEAGHKGGTKTAQLGKSWLKNIPKEQRIINGRKGRMRQLQTTTPEQRSQWSQKGGRAGGRKRVENQTPEQRSAIGRLGALARGPRTSEERTALSKAMTGSIWVTNGVQNLLIRPGKSIPEGWKRGRIATWRSIAHKRIGFTRGN